jgi:hypothetical protein
MEKVNLDRTSVLFRRKHPLDERDYLVEILIYNKGNCVAECQRFSKFRRRDLLQVATAPLHRAVSLPSN